MEVIQDKKNGDHGSPKSPQRNRPLTSKQEKKLVDYLDETFLELTRNFKKRSEESSTLKTLSSYIDAARHLLALILQIPPLDPSTGLRVAYLLRLTGDSLGAIPGYTLGTETSVNRETLQDIIDFLDDLDEAWLAVLQGQIWDPETAAGVDLIVPVDMTSRTPNSNGGSSTVPTNLKSTPPSQTDIARLRSLIFAGESVLEEWLASQRANVDAQADHGDELEDVSGMLARMGLLHEFDSLFVRTLDYLGGFAASVSRNVVDPPEESMME
ncbi:hypothetical protein GALMADRAFT_135437 [Galerina marginata CBS 339.88]|uniref:Uncharacterized protein n=1 Tax=Galerina marginata (strain CBS 339.88) TaxID=685588 RepID=A0A067TFS7_GALM3|nr:hypothetical protein GALMADRAFT_135437 [Galerina marginata CBS 339.88]